MYTSRYFLKIIWGEIVILIGVLLLLNNYGIVPYSSWNIIARLWPVILILIGLRMLSRINKIFYIIFSILSIILILLFFAFTIFISKYNYNDIFNKYFNSPVSQDA